MEFFITTTIITLWLASVHHVPSQGGLLKEDKTSAFKKNILESCRYCGSKFSTTFPQALALLKGQEGDQNAKCFLHCMMQRYKLVCCHNTIKTKNNKRPLDLEEKKNDHKLSQTINDEMDKEGNYDKEKFEPFMEKMPDSKFLTSIKENVDACVKEDDKEPCEKALKFTKCFYNKGGMKKDQHEDILPVDGF